MKKKRLLTNRIVKVLKQGEMAMTVADLMRPIGISLRGSSVRSRLSTAGRSTMTNHHVSREERY